MSWSYSGDPSSSDKDAVRFLIGDTDTNNQLLQDEEINYLLTTQGSVYAAAAEAAMSIAAKFARLADQTVGDLRISYSQRAEAYKALADSLSRRGDLKFVEPYAGGISKSDKESVELDTDRVEPAFERGQFDFEHEVNRNNEDN